LTDALIDGNVYGRKNGAWEKITASTFTDTNWQTSWGVFDANMRATYNLPATGGGADTNTFTAGIMGSDNNRFKIDLNVSKADPEMRLTDTGDNEYARWTRTDTAGEVKHLARVDIAGGSNLGTDLNLHYLMNDNAANTTVLDNLGANNGTASRNTSLSTTSGRINTALDFNGANDFILLPATTFSGATSSSFSVSFWLWADNFNNYNGYIGFAGASESMKFNISTAAWEAPAGRLVYQAGGLVESLVSDVISASTWYHIVIVHSGGTATIYKNTAVWGSGAQTLSKLSALGTTLWLGKTAASSQYVDGKMDDVRFYNRALTAAEITTLYNAGSGTESEASIVTTTEETYLDVKDGTDGTESSTITLGASGARTIINGASTRFNVGGTEKGSMSSTGLTWIDNYKTWWGTGRDASAYYDGANFFLNPREVGTGQCRILGDTNIAASDLYMDNNAFLATKTTSRVGIGTTTPRNKLNVVGDINASGTTSFINVDTNYRVLGTQGVTRNTRIVKDVNVDGTFYCDINFKGGILIGSDC
jgi:hypothetical protein